MQEKLRRCLFFALLDKYFTQKYENVKKAENAKSRRISSISKKMTYLHKNYQLSIEKIRDIINSRESVLK